MYCAVRTESLNEMDRFLTQTFKEPCGSRRYCELLPLLLNFSLLTSTHLHGLRQTIVYCVKEEPSLLLQTLTLIEMELFGV